MHRIDHVALGVRHIYEGSERLRDETGLDNYDSGWFPGIGIGQRLVPLGKHCYIEIESIIDHDMAINHFFGKWFEAVLADAGREDCWMGWTVAVDTFEELQAAAERTGTVVHTIGKPIEGTADAQAAQAEAAWGRRRPSGAVHAAQIVPDARHHPWPRGLPNWIWWANEENDHPDTVAEAASVQHRVSPHGIAWVELGDEALTREWLGPEADAYDVRYVDAPAGLYAVGIPTDQGELVLRLPPAPLRLGSLYAP